MVRGLHKLENEMRSFRGEEMKRGDDLMDALAYIRDVAYTPQTQKTQEELDKEQNHQMWQAIISEAEQKEKEREKATWRVHDSYRDIDRYF